MDHPFTINAPSYVRDRLSVMAKAAGTTIGEAAVYALRQALPTMQETWEQYAWPPKRAIGIVRRTARASVQFKLPRDLFLAYTEIADKVITKALYAGWFPKHDPALGPPEVDYPTPWLLNTTLQEHLSSTAPMPVREVVLSAPGVTDGPIVMVPLPAPVVEWMLRSGFNRSAFIRGAIEAQLPVLAQAQTIPPMSRLMQDSPNRNTPVRMSRTMHADLKAAAKTKGVSMSHMMRAACLTHLAAQNAKRQPAPAPQPQQTGLNP